MTRQRSEETAVLLRKQKHVMMFQTQLQILGFAAIQEQLWTDLDLQLDVFRCVGSNMYHRDALSVLVASFRTVPCDHSICFLAGACCVVLRLSV